MVIWSNIGFCVSLRLRSQQKTLTRKGLTAPPSLKGFSKLGTSERLRLNRWSHEDYCGDPERESSRCVEEDDGWIYGGWGKLVYIIPLTKLKLRHSVSSLSSSFPTTLRQSMLKVGTSNSQRFSTFQPSIFQPRTLSLSFRFYPSPAFLSPSCRFCPGPRPRPRPKSCK